MNKYIELVIIDLVIKIRWIGSQIYFVVRENVIKVLIYD